MNPTHRSSNLGSELHQLCQRRPPCAMEFGDVDLLDWDAPRTPLTWEVSSANDWMFFEGRFVEFIQICRLKCPWSQLWENLGLLYCPDIGPHKMAWVESLQIGSHEIICWKSYEIRKTSYKIVWNHLKSLRSKFKSTGILVRLPTWLRNFSEGHGQQKSNVLATLKSK